jgi:uncharacterized membrane protein
MSPFLSGVLGAAALLLTLGFARRLVWHRYRRHWRSGRRPPLRRLFALLRTRPDQEQVITAEAEAFWHEASSWRGEGRALREELADLLAGETVDAGAVSATLERRLEKLQALRGQAAEAVARVHAVLDADQRARAAALLRHGPHGHRHAHGHC